MNNVSDTSKKRRDTILKVILIIIIILLLIHNCTLLKKYNEYKNKPDPNGNTDIIEIKCEDNKCKPIDDDKPKVITSLSFVQKNISVKTGNKQKLVVVVKPSSLASSKFTWKSSDPSIATVDSNGNVTGLKEGTVTITVTSSNGISTTCTVKVTNDTIPVNKIILNPTNITMKVGDVEQISSKVEPESATERDLVWSSSDSSVASVDENGVIKGLKEGTVTITVKTKDGKVVSTSIVTVEKIKVDKIVLSPTSMTLNVGESNKITATVKPDNAADKEIVWSSSDPSIATVDSNGKVTGLKEGTVTITAKTKDGKVVSTSTVTVKAIKVNEIVLNPTHMALNVGGSGQIVATLKPDNATDKEIIWTTSDSSIATVDSTGKVTGIKEGTVTITAKTKDGKVVSTCTVEVKTEVIPVESITLSMEYPDVNVGTFEQVIATINPSNATVRELAWTSSDTSIATVDSTGKVTGVTAGTVTITATTKDGKASAKITVTVKEPIVDGDVEAYDREKDPITWNGSTDLKIFSKSIYNVDGVLAPESENTYQFIVKNNTKYRIKYNIIFVETNDHNINMQYKLKKNSTYVISNYTRPSDMVVEEYTLNSGESDTYYLDWKWISSSNDTQIGAASDVTYKLQIEVEAESING